jgi:hypothetical protein
MRREEWGKLGNDQKRDYLFNWSERLEEAVKRLDVTIQLLDARIGLACRAFGDRALRAELHFYSDGPGYFRILVTTPAPTVGPPRGVARIRAPSLPFREKRQGAWFSKPAVSH